VKFDHRQEIRAAQVRLLFEQLPSALFATLVNAGILTAVLWRDVSPRLLIGWLLLILLLALGRHANRRAYDRRSSADSESLLWSRHYLYGVAANGVLWGAAGYFFFTTHSYTHQVFLAFVLMGMASGGIASLSSLPGAYLLFVIPALTPYGIQLLKSGDRLHLAMLAMLVLYVVMLTTIGHRLYRTVRESLRLRFENLDLLRDLTQSKDWQERANQELAAQIAEKRVVQDALQRAYGELEIRVGERTAELATSEEALRNANKRKDEFLAMLGHELRNPLTPIRGALYIMQKTESPNAEVKWARDIIDRQVTRLTRLVDDLLDVSRIMYGKISLRESLLEIGTVINQAVEGSLPFIESREQDLSLQVPKETLWIKGDSIRLEQVISNLLNNASKYSDVGAQIRLRIEASEKWVTVRVQDNGIGMSPEVMPYIFDLFAQADHSLARTQGGLGIGLTVVKRLVEMHGGRVEAHSPGKGHGAEFVVHLPRWEAASRKSFGMAQPKPAQDSEKSIRVLVVDDNQDAAETIAMVLSFKGFTVATAFDGITALAEAARFQPQVVLLDIGMPGMDGYAVAQELRAGEQTKSIIIIAVTGYGQPEDKARAKAVGFTDHLTKPVTPDLLSTVMKEHLAGR
jgi:signal transduction histidine kinase/ActR/RegA family two-component response regulator